MPPEASKETRDPGTCRSMTSGRTASRSRGRRGTRESGRDIIMLSRRFPRRRCNIVLRCPRLPIMRMYVCTQHLFACCWNCLESLQRHLAALRWPPDQGPPLGASANMSPASEEPRGPPPPPPHGGPPGSTRARGDDAAFGYVCCFVQCSFLGNAAFPCLCRFPQLFRVGGWTTT